MSAISVWLKCAGCGVEDSVLLRSPIEFDKVETSIERQAMGMGWKIRTPASKPPVQICPKCSKEGKI